MNESWIPVGSEQYAIRATLKRLYGSKGIGINQLNVILELTCQKSGAEKVPIWLRGTVSIRNLGSHSGYLATLQCAIQPIELNSVGATKEIALTADISTYQVQAIEDQRIGSVLLNFDFSGHCIAELLPQPFWGVQFEDEISQSDWIAILERVGYRRIILLELDTPNDLKFPEQALALKFFSEAQKHYLEHNWRLTVESLRQTLSALVGKQPDDDNSYEDGRDPLKEIRKQVATRNIGYEERYEPIRAALKFLCDLGGHPEIADTGKQQASSAFIMVGGLLQGLSK